MEKKVPFFANTQDDLHCFVAVLKMILKHFIPEKEYSSKELDKLSDKVSGKWTWATRALLNLQEMNFDIVIIDTFDWKRFSVEGGNYLKEFYDEKIAQKQIENSDLSKEIRDAKELVNKIKISNRIPSIDDMAKFLRFGYLMGCNVNSNSLNGKDGYTARFVLVYKVDDDNVYLHDPGLPPLKAKKVSREQFEKSWAYPNEHNKNLTLFRLKSPYKVFGIGLSRTGTTSLNEALLELGYFAIHYPLDWDIIDRADAATDIPVSHSYKELDKMYPGAKFIYTKRALFPWLNSMRKHYKRKPAESRNEDTLKHRKKMYETIYFEPLKLIPVYLKHTREVKAYFKNRKEDYLEMDITKGDGWVILCKFLGKKIPDTPFPKTNTAKQNAEKDKLKTQTNGG